MDGKTALYSLRQLLEEDSDSGFMDDYTSYRFLNDAAYEFALRTSALKSYQEITTVADQVGYTLNADFMKLHMKDSEQRFFVKYSDGTNTNYLTWKPYEEIIYANNTTSTTVPSHFTIIDDPTLDTQLTGTVTSSGAASGGSCTLADTTADFSDVSANDIVHNVTDGGMGVVISKTSTTALVTALFGGTDNGWAYDGSGTDDTYVIQPQGRFQLLLDPPPSEDDDTVTVYYAQRPAPVYSDYGVFRFPQQFTEALVKYAAWLYKYRDKQPNYGDKWFMMFESAIRKYADQTDNILRRKQMVVNWKGR